MDTDRLIQKSWRFSGRTANLPWYPRTGTRNDLAVLLGKWQFNIGVEVGTYKGEYAEILCRANPRLKLTCVDPWTAYKGYTQEFEDKVYNIAIKRLAPFRIKILKTKSLDSAKIFKPGILDFVFIDGDHSFDSVIQDIIQWSDKVRVGGLVMVHDYWVSGMGCDVVKAIDAYTHCHNITPWYLTRENIAPTAFWVKK